MKAASPTPTHAPVPSPCIDVCTMDETTGWCRGCLRTIDEIAAWGVLEDRHKREVWKHLAERRGTPAGRALVAEREAAGQAALEPASGAAPPSEDSTP
jgi:predicted Fe-S protein YdhL (DUF1289 family)